MLENLVMEISMKRVYCSKKSGLVLFAIIQAGSGTEDFYMQIYKHCLNPFQEIFPHNKDNQYTNLLTTNHSTRLISSFLGRGRGGVGMLHKYTSGAIVGTRVRSTLHADILVLLARW
jgi:hypothetical protein